MIKNWSQHSLYMDFSGLKTEKHGQPSDIDMFYLGKDGYVILGEIKNGCGEFSDVQRGLYKEFAERYGKDKCIVLFITHNVFVEQTRVPQVDVAHCDVVEYLFNGEWQKPKKKTEVCEFIEKYS